MSPPSLHAGRVRCRSASVRGLEDRVPHDGVCGGCALQHWDLAPYLAWKVERLRGTLALQRLETEILAPFAANPGRRRRVVLHARKGASDAARLGFKARKSWDLVEIGVCPIADPAIQAALPML